MQDLEGKTAVVTGGASGIGLALAGAFAAESMKVVVADVEVAALEKAAAALAEGGAEVLAVPTDVRDPEAVRALADAAVDAFGGVHVLCNNAGVVARGDAWSDTAERFRWVIEVNLLGVAHGIQAFVPRMIEQGEGYVVNTASAAGLVTGPGMASYFASKHGVVGLTEALANDLALAGHTGIGCSVLCPEWVRTRIHEAERNLPDGVSSPAPPTDAAAAAEDYFGAMVEAGVEPSDVAAKVVDAVRHDRFWVLPHDTTLDMARIRWRKIEEDRPPVLWE